jgi:hypothetical protein
VGQLATDLFSVESAMRLTEGQTRNYSESQRANEFVLIDKTDPASDRVVSVTEERLASEREIALPGFPFTLKVHQYFENSAVTNRADTAGAEPPVASQGIGPRLSVRPAPSVVRMDMRNIPSAIVELTPSQGASLGTWAVSPWLEQPQRFTHDGRTYEIALRFARYYKPFSLALLDFRHDKYKGTEIPKNFSSRVRLERPDTGENREVLIFMNNPLRYEGETFYQSGYDPDDPRVTILQVVRNPSWLTPYLACVLVGLGLTIQFLTHLVEFAKRRTA